MDEIQDREALMRRWRERGGRRFAHDTASSPMVRYVVFVSGLYLPDHEVFCGMHKTRQEAEETLPLLKQMRPDARFRIVRLVEQEETR